MNENEKILKLISGILLRSLIIALGLLVIWLVAYLALGDFFIPIHARIFDISETDVRLLNLEGVVLFRALAICFFLCPLIAIELLIRSKKVQ